MDFDDFRLRLVMAGGCTIIVFVLWGGMMWMQHARIEKHHEESREVSYVPVPVSSAGQKTSEFHKALSAQDVARAEKLLGELRKLDANHRSLSGLESSLRQAKLEAVRRKAQAAVKNWKRSPGTDDRALEPLVDAAELDPLGQEQALIKTLAEGVPFDRLNEVALRLVRERPAAALAFLHAALEAGSRVGNDPVRRVLYDQLSVQLDRARLAAAKEVLAGRIPGANASTARTLLDHVRSSNDPQARREALALMFEGALAAAREAQAAKEFSNAEGRLKDAAELGTKLWMARLDEPGADPWKGVPAEVRDDLEDANPGAEPAALVNALKAHVHAQKWRPAESARIHVQLPGLWAEWGVAELASNRESALDRLRTGLRSSDAAARRVADAGLRAAVRDALAKKDFAALLDLTGFTVAETSMDPGDAFRGELKTGLEAAGEHFGEKSPRTRVFVQSLLADVLAGDPAAEKARADAFAMGEQLMQGLQAKPEVPDLRLPSLLKGYSVMSIENGTNLHLLLFFSGPEKFYVRLNPVRRGLLVIKDGAYTTAVMGNTEEVQPYRGTQTFSSEVAEARYTVSRVGSRSNDFFTGPPAFGPFTLLHVAAGADRKQVEERWVKRAAEAPDEGRTKALAQIRSPNPGVAGDAARELGKHPRSKEAFEALAWALKSHPSEDLRHVAAEQLRYFRRRFDVLGTFEKAAAAEADGARANRLISAAVHGSLPGAERLVELGLSRPQPELRKSMVRLLADKRFRVADAPAEAMLLKLIGTEPDVLLRRAAVRALAERGSARAYGPVAALLNSQDLKDRSDGLFLASGYLRQDPRTGPLLLQAEARETNRGLRGDMLRNICARGGNEYPTLLASRLRTGTKIEKMDVLHYLYVWSGPVAPLAPALQAASADPDPQVRQKATAKLAELRARPAGSR